ncbi:zinc ribbon domain-containing protein [bacterium]|nr:zinc ribbon domain-containing protein [bacterium]
MPLYEFKCSDCGENSEILVTGSSKTIECRSCGSHNLKKLLSVPSSLSGVSKSSMPAACAPCCGSSPEHAGCQGPGSCCGHNFA